MNTEKKDPKLGSQNTANSSVEGMLNSLRKAVKRRESLLPEKESEELECMCEGQDKIFVKVEENKKSYAVCPACDPKKDCELCNGTGHLLQFNSETGTEETIPNGCSCLFLEKRLSLLNAANIPDKYLHCWFSLQDIMHAGVDSELGINGKYASNQEKIYDFCNDANELIINGSSPGDLYFLTLVGPVGTGKTHLAICALKRIIMEFGHAGHFIDFQVLLAQIRDSYSRKTSEDDIMQPLRSIPVLLIDEFGKGRTENEWELEKLDDLVNHRYNNGKVTIITTNYLPPGLHNTFVKSQVGNNTNDNYNSGKRKINPNDLPTNAAYLTANDSQFTPNPYLVQTLPQRIGERLYDRIVEVSLFIDFLGISSFRKRAAESFLQEYNSKI